MFMNRKERMTEAGQPDDIREAISAVVEGLDIGSLLNQVRAIEFLVSRPPEEGRGLWQKAKNAGLTDADILKAAVHCIVPHAREAMHLGLNGTLGFSGLPEDERANVERELRARSGNVADLRAAGMETAHKLMDTIANLGNMIAAAGESGQLIWLPETSDTAKEEVV